MALRLAECHPNLCSFISIWDHVDCYISILNFVTSMRAQNPKLVTVQGYRKRACTVTDLHHENCGNVNPLLTSTLEKSYDF
jgi:hypothetical protein